MTIYPKDLKTLELFSIKINIAMISKQKWLNRWVHQQLIAKDLLWHRQIPTVSKIIFLDNL